MSLVNTYSGNVTSLADTDVFVFGANLGGFHGAGSAGYASFGVAGNVWRQHNYAAKPDGWQGKWNRKGHVGPQVGTDGKSYGLVTVTRAGAKRSINRDQMVEHIQQLYACCERNPSWTFYMAQGHKGGLNGYSGKEMADFFASTGFPPDNLLFQSKFGALIDESLDNHLKARLGV